MLRRILCIALIVLAGVSCSRDPEVVKKKYVQNGNRYYEKGKYKEAYIMYRNALKKDARYSEAYYRVGLTELRMGQPIAALRDMRRASDTDPNFSNPDARVQAGNILLAAYVLNETHPPVLKDELRSMSTELLKHNPKSVQGLRLRGYLKLVADRDPNGAVEDFRLADQISPSNPDIVLPLVQALQGIGQGAEGERIGKDLIAKRKDFIAMYDVLYVTYLREKRMDDAEAMLKLKAANNPNEPAYLLQLAQHYYRANRRPEMQGALDRVLSDRKAYPLGPLQVGRFYEAIRDHDAAMKQFEEGARTNSERKADYEREIVQVLIAENKRDEAVRMLDRITQANPKDERAQAMRASLLIETGDSRQIQQAITELQAAVGQDTKNPVLRFNLGRALLAKGQLEQARVQFQEAIKIRHEYVPARLALAQLFIITHEYGSAVQTAKEVLESDPHNLAARLVRASGLAAMGNSALARAEITETVAQFPDSAEAQLQLAVLDLSEKHYKEAEQRFRQVYDKHPADLRALMGIAESYGQQGQYDKAMELLQGELAKYPGRLELRAALGNVAAQGKKYDVAIAQYQAVIAARPDASDVYVRLGQTLAVKGDYEGAMRTFEKAKQLRPNDPDAYLQLALLMDHQGNRANARQVYEQVLKMRPDQPLALNNLAYLLAESGTATDLDQALQLATRARQKLPEDPDIADTLGWIYIKKNLTPNALNLFQGILAMEPKLSPGHPFSSYHYHYHYALALAQSGDKPQARKELKAALDRKPSADEAAKIKELLGKLG